MGPREIILIGQKMANLTSCLGELEPLVTGAFPGPKWSRVQQRAVERLIQVVVESLIDVNTLVVADAKAPPATSAREGFERVHSLGVIQTRLLDRFGHEYVKLRNRIVHAYDTLDDRTVYYKAQRLVKETKQYQQAIDRYVRTRRATTTKSRSKKESP